MQLTFKENRPILNNQIKKKNLSQEWLTSGLCFNSFQIWSNWKPRFVVTVGIKAKQGVMKRTYCQGNPMAMSCFPGLGSGTVTYRQHLSLRTNWGWGFSSLLASLPVPIPFWQLLPFRTRDWTQDSLSLPRHGQMEFLHDCSSVLELFYQMGSVFIRKERRKGRRNEERKGRRRGGERITVFTVLSDVFRVVVRW